MRRILLLLLMAPPAMAIDFSDRQSLVELAIAKHPTLSRIRAEEGAARERIGPAAALPDPMFMAGVENKQIDLTNDEMMTMYTVGASQTLTRPSRREARRNVAELAARVFESETASVRAEVERDVLLAWYDVAAADAALQTVESVRELVAAMVAAARVRYEVGNAEQADVLRAQLQQSGLDHDILRLKGTRRAALARLLPLLDLPLDTPVPALQIPEGTDDLPLDASNIPPPTHPALAALETDVALAEEEIRLARLDLRPDIEVEAQYGYRPTQRDMFTVVARIPIPVRIASTIEPRVREAILRRDAATARIAETRRALAQALAAAVVAHEEVTHQLHLHEQVLVPQAQLAFESTLTAYQTGKNDFEAILGAQSEYVRLRLQYFDYLARHAQAVVNYEALLRGARGSAMPAAGALAIPGTSSGSPASNM